MPKATHSLHMKKPYERHLLPVYAVTLLLILHYSMVLYVNSSYLEQFIDSAGVGTIYTVGSAVSILTFLFISRVLHKVGNFKLTVALLLVDFLAVIGMAYAEELRVAVPLFIIHLITVPLIIFNIDVFIEEQIGKNESSTGTKRGALLALASFVGAVSPLITGFIIGEGDADFTNAYLLSAGTLIPVLILLIFYFKDFSDPVYNELNVFSAIRSFWVRKNIRNVFLCSFSLQLFFVLMVVYTPLYLTSEIGLSWTDFGIIMFFAQLAYTIFEYPVGYIADKYIGEKEMMGFGFLIMAVATSWIAFVISSSIMVWILIMFITRVGAAFVEVTTESYFFKKTEGSDAQVISFFRTTRPLSYVVGALLASFALLYLPFNLLFVATALLMVPALFLTLDIEDTK